MMIVMYYCSFGMQAQNTHTHTHNDTELDVTKTERSFIPGEWKQMVETET